MELTELVQFSVTDTAIAKLADLYMDLRITSVADLSGFKAVHAARMVIKGKRVEVEKRRKELKEEALEWGRRVDGEARRIFDLLEPIEKHLEGEEEAYQEKKMEQKRETEAKEAARLQGMFDALAKYGMVLPWEEIKRMDHVSFAARLSEAEQAYAA